MVNDNDTSSNSLGVSVASRTRSPYQLTAEHSRRDQHRRRGRSQAQLASISIGESQQTRAIKRPTVQYLRPAKHGTRHSNGCSPDSIGNVQQEAACLPVLFLFLRRFHSRVAFRFQFVDFSFGRSPCFLFIFQLGAKLSVGFLQFLDPEMHSDMTDLQSPSYRSSLTFPN